MIRQLYPGCPAGASGRSSPIPRFEEVAGSGAAGQALDPQAVALAVAASVRHEDTGDDELLMSGVPRAAARERVRSEVQEILGSWRVFRAALSAYSRFGFPTGPPPQAALRVRLAHVSRAAVGRP
ncbi:MAG: DUF2293 domain-containing protein [Candidatus Dormibacteria bacterium]